jgi:hypothetical protein
MWHTLCIVVVCVINHNMLYVWYIECGRNTTVPRAWACCLMLQCSIAAYHRLLSFGISLMGYCSAAAFSARGGGDPQGGSFGSHPRLAMANSSKESNP